MSIPRAKITACPAGDYHWTCPGDSAPLTVEGCISIEEAANEFRSHLRRAHGVRTVGSLTANDIGKWVEIEGRKPFQLGGLEHGGSTTMFNADPDARPYAYQRPHTAPCRVTEERP